MGLIDLFCKQQRKKYSSGAQLLLGLQFKKRT
uniref:BLTX311 n=1 Tax=Nephila pilipes TaxID=299642 RepID=A0A076L280_NEPPI|nr:BLTX311 [Nephila pilipes]